MSAGQHDFAGEYAMEQGATFSRVVTWRDEASALVNLTGYTAALQVRQYHDATTALLSLTSSPAAGLTLGGALGTITIVATAAQTRAIDAPAVLVYDLELTSGSGLVTRLLEGKVEITPEVTR